MKKSLIAFFRQIWRSSSGTFQSVVEDHCIQDLMLGGLLANRGLATSVFEPVLCVLDRLHQARTDRLCQAMVCRLWKPLLWRHLRVASWQVRANAAQLFLSAFPVENPQLGLRERSEAQSAQHQVLLLSQ